MTIEYQMRLFDDTPKVKSYRAIRHDIVRERQSSNSDDTHHPDQKLQQVKHVLTGANLKILELFAGRGNLTKAYAEYGEVLACDRKYKKTGDSFLLFHELISKKQFYDVVDLDPYGFPCRLFPDVFLLIKHGLLFVTFPKPYVNILNGITQTLLSCYFGQTNPSREAVIEQIAVWGLGHWRQVELLHSIDLSSVWRFVFRVDLVKATEYTGVRNR